MDEDSDHCAVGRAAAQRLFLALWPPDTVRAQLAALGRERFLGISGRWISAANLHATLIFLGSVEASQRRCIEQAAAAVRAPAFHASFDRLGWFARPQVLWVGVAETPPALTRLVEDLGAAVQRCGFAVEKREYHLHVTLARKVRRRVPGTATAPIDWHVDHFALVESHMHRAGAVYEVLHTWPLNE